ncbi:MAG: iron-sulfur cluster binding protein [Ignavibacteria bacterium]|nr:MAG: iron-sulfur cluster binding protein [Ignavibacteria bacterium]KAF0161513.1 MAG: iron-sulfur cluster binding protein [Ignavibacteria bacterium]
MNITNEIVIHKAHELGFDLVGFAKADLLEEETSRLQKWLEKDYNASMKYMSLNLEKRKEINHILPSAKSVISLAVNYYTPFKHSDEIGTGKISRYAWGKDYHLIIWEKLSLIEEYLKNLDPTFESKSYVDTGPVMDKAWAVRSGIGWLGKNSNVINKEIGSWFFIANIITNCNFDYSFEIADHCGTCSACMESCPTNAIVQPYVVDANRCISFLTIENKNEISLEFKGKLDNWIFGCDVCQDVCPWNKKFAEPTLLQEFHPKETNLVLNNVINMSESEFKNKFETSPIKRTKLSGLKRNAAFLINEP